MKKIESIEHVICDRCGEKIEVEIDRHGVAIHCNSHKVFSGWTTFQIFNFSGGTGCLKSIDLCDSCTKKHKKFLENKE